MGDTIHDVGARCVVKSKDELSKIFCYWRKSQRFEGTLQETYGRNWRRVYFHASQLRVIYDLYKDDIVDNYLYGNLSNKKPKLISCIQ